MSLLEENIILALTLKKVVIVFSSVVISEEVHLKPSFTSYINFIALCDIQYAKIPLTTSGSYKNMHT